MLFYHKWDFFHCIRKNRTEPYTCKQVENILSIKIPNINSDEYLIPLCTYTPITWRNYYLEEYLKSKITVQISHIKENE